MVQLVVLTALSVWACVQNLWYWNYLPERVAIHFGANGVADNWLNRGPATALMMALQSILPWVLVLIAGAVKYLPVSAVNIPNREYWLQGPRRDSSLAYLAGFMASVAIAESILISVLNHLSFIANRTGQPLNTVIFLVALSSFMLAVLVLVVQLYRRFGIPRPSDSLAG